MKRIKICCKNRVSLSGAMAPEAAAALLAVLSLPAQATATIVDA